MREILNYLSKKFSKLTDKSRTYVLDHCDELSYRKGEILLKEGDVCCHIWFIKQGYLRAYQSDPSSPDKESTNWFMVENDVATSVYSYFKEVPSEETIVAEEDTVVFRMSQEDMFAGIKKYHDLAILTLMIVVDYYCTTRLLESFLRMKAPQFIYKWILKTCSTLLVRALQAHLASFLGVSEPTYREIKSGKYKQPKA
jgi:CRP-like cAMP-binding protein